MGATDKRRGGSGAFNVGMGINEFSPHFTGTGSPSLGCSKVTAAGIDESKPPGISDYFSDYFCAHDNRYYPLLDAFYRQPAIQGTPSDDEVGGWHVLHNRR